MRIVSAFLAIHRLVTVRVDYLLFDAPVEINAIAAMPAATIPADAER